MQQSDITVQQFYVAFACDKLHRGWDLELEKLHIFQDNKLTISITVYSA